ncbi:hypothetical protein N658DRAFT_485766 [Parathielavia hyrcaniae]|uniref:Uncharacterized protein n=1 Tax=Parathielavia hyrcaniae TaxID=113614 RepID=A0AAN6Q6H0_9PEZI|nr:hypothetical protein N658DRAFT_485766 [Parathielavia hyrcaniae]
MFVRKFLVFASAMLAAVTDVAADNDIPSYLSYFDVASPLSARSTSATCMVNNRTFTAVGIANLESPNDALNGLSWVIGAGAEDVNSTDSEAPERRFEQSFYLGSPRGFEFEGTGACALFFTQVSDEVHFNGDADPRVSKGTCSDAMTDDCISALVDRAKKVDLDGLSGAAACERLQQDFADNFDSACAAFAPASSSSWSGITAKALSGEGSPRPISEQLNAVLDCWPVLPTADDLRLVESTNNTGDLDESTLVENFFSVTPILTVFFPGNGGNSLVSQAEAQLSCLKAVNLTTTNNVTLNPGVGNGDNAAGQLVGRGVAVWVGLASVAFALLLA